MSSESKSYIKSNALVYCVTALNLVTFYGNECNITFVVLFSSELGFPWVVYYFFLYTTFYFGNVKALSVCMF